MYLTEDKLKQYLEGTGDTWVHNKVVPNSVLTRHRPDFRCDELMVIVEFDGYYHFNTPKQIVNDLRKDDEYTLLGYKVVHIPYFLQLDTYVVSSINSTYITTQSYPHGFIDPLALLPSAYCELGIQQFNKVYSKLPEYIQNDIKVSLQNKIIQLGDIRLVLPNSLQQILTK